MGKMKKRLNNSAIFKAAREQLSLVVATFSVFPGVVAMSRPDDLASQLVKINFPASAHEAFQRDLKTVAGDLSKAFQANLK